MVEEIQPPLGVLNQKDLVPLTNAITAGIRKGLEDAEMDPDALTIVTALVGIACAGAAAIDDNYVPPIFLIGFLPEMDIAEHVAISMVRLAYAEHRKYAEAMAERERLGLAVEQAVAEADVQRKTEN